MNKIYWVICIIRGILAHSQDRLLQTYSNDVITIQPCVSQKQTDRKNDPQIYSLINLYHSISPSSLSTIAELTCSTGTLFLQPIFFPPVPSIIPLCCLVRRAAGDIRRNRAGHMPIIQVVSVKSEQLQVYFHVWTAAVIACLPTASTDCTVDRQQQ